MNIPEVSNEVKQNVRSENVVTAEATERPVRDGTAKSGQLVVAKQDNAKSDKQSQHFSREELDSFIKDAEEHLANNDVKLKFNVIEENDTVQVEIVDGDGKTIRKIPDDELLKLSKSLKNLERGFLDEVS